MFSAEAFSKVCVGHLGVEKEVVLTPLMHDTPAELAQPFDVKEWKKGQCDLLPGKTAPQIAVVERDYPAVFKRFTSLGPLMAKVGNGGKGIGWNTQTEVQQLGELNGVGQPAASDLLSALRRRAEIRIADEHARDSFNQLLDREAGLFVMGNQAPTLSHDDLHHANLIFHAAQGRWQLAGVLDWDKAWAGPAESDVARMAFWDDMTGPGFWEVYRAAVPMIDGRSERMLIYPLLWCLEYNETSTRHLIETNSLRGQLGIQ